MKHSLGNLKVGDTVRVIGVPPGLKDTAEFKTKTLFRLCVGETFRIDDFDRYNFLVLYIRKRKPKFKPYRMHSIMIEPHLVRRVRRGKV
jgi:hypothetical protein